MKVKKANIILIILFGFFFSMSNCLAYYAISDTETSKITTSAYEDLTFEFDQEIYGNNIPINLTISNPNPYDITYKFALPNNFTSVVTDYADGAIVEANQTKSHGIVVSGASGSSFQLTIQMTAPYSENYTKTIALDVEAPVATITSTNNQASSQTVTLNMTDNIGVASYYFGTNSLPAISDYTEIEATSLAVINETVNNNGTYYLFIKDASGNAYNTSVDFYKVMLDANGGNVTPANIVAKSGEAIILPTPTLSGKELFEWNTDSAGTGINYLTSYTKTGNGSIILYAIWEIAGIPLYSVLATEATSGSGLAKTYTGAHQDSYAGTGAENIYYYYASNSSKATTILNKNNVIFAGFCWQMFRTTDTGGVKIIYNGEAVDGKCLNTRPTHVGTNSDWIEENLSGTYYYGTSYTHNGSVFSLAGTKKRVSFSSSTYEGVIGWYTCKSSSATGTCSTLYYVSSWSFSTYATVYAVADGVHYSVIDNVPFNKTYEEIRAVGYMHNKSYQPLSKDPSYTSYLFSSSFTYSNGKYTLSGTKRTTNTGTNITSFNNTHYTCWNTSGECETISYIYYIDGGKVNYFDLTGGKSINNALSEMLSADDVNTNNSTIKDAIDAWYEKNMLDYTPYLEDTIFCNDRSIRSLGGFNPNGGSVYDSSDLSKTELHFNQFNVTSSLSCTNVTDRFSVSNPKAKLTYPVGLATAPEMNLLGNAALRKTGVQYWLNSPGGVSTVNPNEFIPWGSGVDETGALDTTGYVGIWGYLGVRPTISLAPETEYSSGDGSMANPYVIKMSAGGTISDDEMPSATIISTNNQDSSQIVTLNMTDNLGVVSYYFGTNSNPSESDYIEIETTVLAIANETIDNNGTYYLFVKDIGGNIFNTSVDFYKVNLDPTGGSITITTILAKSGNEIELPTSTQLGKAFVKWNTVLDGSGASYITSYTENGNGSITLYAIWVVPETPLYSVLATEATSGSGLVKTYTGAHQDSYAGTGDENIYYYYASNNTNATTVLDKNNVIFAGFCWQMFRTTDTGGVKIIYNGEAVDDQCLNTRPLHLGFNGTKTIQTLSGSRTYGTSYTWERFMFVLAGETKTATWSSTTYQDLIGTYTCGGDYCEILYYIDSYYSDTAAYVLTLENGFHYSTIGGFPFNSNEYSIASVGYMYNTSYPPLSREPSYTSYLFSSSFTYSNGKYTLSGTKQTTNTGTNITSFNNTHYTCWNTSGECETISYIYYIDGGKVNYFDLTGGKSINDALTEMLSADDVNANNSTIKDAIDTWYEENMLDYTPYLEDTIFCNDRSIRSLGGFNPNGGSVYEPELNDLSKTQLHFNQFNVTSSLSCTNVTDQFSVSNPKAKLTYPVGLATAPEMNLLGNATLRKTGVQYWLNSPEGVSTVNPNEFNPWGAAIDSTGALTDDTIALFSGVRPIISLAPGTEYIYGGDGSMANPYMVKTSE